MSEKPCIHAIQQAASQLHGVCIFCYRDRLAELRTRVAELEKKHEENQSRHIEETGQKIEMIWKLQTRLSTLLKASEGMEKALEELDKLGRCWIQHNVMGSAGFISGAAVCEQTKPALAEWKKVSKENG